MLTYDWCKLVLALRLSHQIGYYWVVIHSCRPEGRHLLLLSAIERRTLEFGFIKSSPQLPLLHHPRIWSRLRHLSQSAPLLSQVFQCHYENSLQIFFLTWYHPVTHLFRCLHLPLNSCSNYFGVKCPCLKLLLYYFFFVRNFYLWLFHPLTKTIILLYFLVCNY